MSETDSFIDEVTEEVRRDRLFALMRKYGWIGITVIVLVVAGSAVVEYRRVKAETAAQAFGDAVLAAMAGEDLAAGLAQVPAEGAGAVALRELLAAAAMIEAGDKAGAEAKLAALQATELPKSLQDLVALKRALATVDLAARKAALQPLAAAGAPYRALALEGLALAALEAGERAAAVEQLLALLQEPELSQGLKRRVGELLVTLGEAPDGASAQ